MPQNPLVPMGVRTLTINVDTSSAETGGAHAQAEQ